MTVEQEDGIIIAAIRAKIKVIILRRKVEMTKKRKNNNIRNDNLAKLFKI